MNAEIHATVNPSTNMMNGFESLYLIINVQKMNSCTKYNSREYMPKKLMTCCTLLGIIFIAVIHSVISEGIPIINAKLWHAWIPENVVPTFSSRFNPMATIRKGNEYRIFSSIQFFLIAINIPAPKTGRRSVVHANTPIGDCHSNPTCGLTKIPFKKKTNKTNAIVMHAHFLSE